MFAGLIATQFWDKYDIFEKKGWGNHPIPLYILMSINYAQLGSPDKDCTIKGLIVFEKYEILRL